MNWMTDGIILIWLRHPGNLNSTDSYSNPWPEAVQPTVAFQGIVNNSGGQLNTGSTLLHYRLQVTVYNSSTKAEHTFPVTIYLKSGQQWANFPSQRQIFVRGCIFGTTKENQQLVIVALSALPPGVNIRACVCVYAVPIATTSLWSRKPIHSHMHSIASIV